MNMGNFGGLEKEGWQEGVRYLAQEEKGRSRKLWEQCFAEDSARFLDYYYQEKCRDNQILVLEALEEGKAGEVVSMVQRNPYQVSWGGRQYRLDYLVGVATAKEWRRRGYMKALLGRVLADEFREGMPFSFLMPADPAIYEPFGFSYIYDQPEYCLTGRGLRLRREKVNGEEEAAKAGEWLEGWLKKRYGLFAVRDRAYMIRLFREIESEYGDWELIWDGERMAGMECFWGKESRERRFLYAEEEYLECTKSRPAIMARIVNLEAFMENISLKEGWEKIEIGILDGQVEENNGLFSWELTEEGSRIRRISREIPEGSWTVSIGELTGWLLGYVSPRVVFNRGNQMRGGNTLPQKLWDIRMYGSAFLDEIV